MEETNVTITTEEMQGEPASKENETKPETARRSKTNVHRQVPIFQIGRASCRERV